jgi:dynein heavy chain, axonemal
VIQVMQVLRPDRLVAALRVLAACELGVPSLAPQPLNIDSLAEEASPGTPVLFIVSAGGDPSSELRSHAAKYATVRLLISKRLT